MKDSSIVAFLTAVFMVGFYIGFIAWSITWQWAWYYYMMFYAGVLFIVSITVYLVAREEEKDAHKQ